MVNYRPTSTPSSQEDEGAGLPANFDADAETLRVVVAPDSFKGSATSQQAAEWIAEGIQSVIVDCDINHIPMADGGEGTAALFSGETITLPTTDAAGRLTEASYTFNAAEQTAYIDVSAASGLPAVKDNPVPLTGDTYGTGVLIADAQTRGSRRIVLGLGGSATIDGGTGVLVALGANPLDSDGHPLRHGGGALGDLDHFDTAKVNIPAASVEWVLLADSEFPATGPNGAAHVFGPQKGASLEEINKVDAALAHLCEVTGVDPEQPGYGAAGAIAVGITWLSELMHGNTEHVHVVSGARTVASAQGLKETIANAHFVVTGEGKYDGQSTAGKVVSVVTELAEGTDAIVAVLAGEFDTEVPEGVLAVDIGEQTDDVRAQLMRAGAQAAVDYLNTSTAQG
ncbi:glycerate kinase [Corynebacterium sp. P3-F1]|uniref:glycerate kinase n=1 Tax=Corynebacterium sp. P3-F1 TaxID=3059080 RepID=UPI00265CF6A1|nr:glycerate kinase [Corynebacterium sp. P3-F1]WKK61795.1 glycerate kinase [Corynebacterium sp. P3-F1]